MSDHLSEKRICNIEDIGDERVSLYTNYNEPQLYHINEPGPGIFVAETPMVIERAMDYGAKPISFFVESGALAKDEVQSVLDRSPAVPVFTAELPVINRITGFNLTRGMLAAFERPQLPSVAELLSAGRNIAVLEDIVNPTNIGAIFRSAAALGVDRVLLTSGSTDPFYRRSARVSMGTVFMIPWTYIPGGATATDLLHDHGFTVISMALTDTAIPLTDPVLLESDKRAIVFGSEGDGLSEETLRGSDHIAIIPMQNGVDSLNVAASSAVAFWHLIGYSLHNCM